MKVIKSILCWCGGVLLMSIVSSPMYSWRANMARKTQEIENQIQAQDKLKQALKELEEKHDDKSI